MTTFSICLSIADLWASHATVWGWHEIRIIPLPVSRLTLLTRPNSSKQWIYEPCFSIIALNNAIMSWRSRVINCLLTSTLFFLLLIIHQITSIMIIFSLHLTLKQEGHDGPISLTWFNTTSIVFKVFTIYIIKKVSSAPWQLSTDRNYLNNLSSLSFPRNICTKLSLNRASPFEQEDFSSFNNAHIRKTSSTPLAAMFFNGSEIFEQSW